MQLQRLVEDAQEECSRQRCRPQLPQTSTPISHPQEYLPLSEQKLRVSRWPLDLMYHWRQYPLRMWQRALVEYGLLES